MNERLRPLFARIALTATVSALFLSLACAPAAAAPPVAPAATPPSPPTPSASPPAPAPAPEAPPPKRHAHDGHVDRLEFVLTSDDAAVAGPVMAFDLTLVEDEEGEVKIGKNVALGAASPTAPSPRQDVGLRLKAMPHGVGGDLLVVFTMELSALENPSSVRKIIATGVAVGQFGKAVAVTTIQDDKKHYKLTMTPTRLR
jgi:hypothetical protein